MASYYLVNPVRLGTVVFKAGTLIDDVIHDVEGLQKAGGLLLPASNADAAAAAADALDARRRGDDLMATSLMIAGAIRAVQPSRVTPLDANHLHAWEMTDANGSTTLADTGSSTSRVPLTLTGGILQTEGLLGKCVQFGTSAAGADSTDKAAALTSAFSDLPTGSVTLDLWYRSQAGNLGFLAGVDVVGSNRFMLDGNASSTGQIGASVNANSFKTATTPATRLLSYGYTWHHAGLVYDQTSGLVQIFVDGEVMGRATGQAGPVTWSTGTTPTFGLATGQNAAGSFRGQLSRVRLSNIARPQSYFRAVYAKGMGL